MEVQGRGRSGGLISEKRDCRERKCTTEPCGFKYHHTSTTHKIGAKRKMKKKK